jgi:hypothetical protein
MFRAFPECAASRRRLTLTEKRASIAHARSFRVKRGNYRPVQKMAAQATDEIIQAIGRRQGAA